MIRPLCILFSSTMAVGFSACAPAPISPRPEVEVVTISEQIEEDLRKTPTEFVVPFSEDRNVWARANYFLGKYTEGSSGAGNREDRVLTNRSSKRDAFIYEVSREQVQDGIRYSVRCFPGRQEARGGDAITNARNLSRFLKEGHLEVSMIRPPVS